MNDEEYQRLQKAAEQAMLAFFSKRSNWIRYIGIIEHWDEAQIQRCIDACLED